MTDLYRAPRFLPSFPLPPGRAPIPAGETECPDCCHSIESDHDKTGKCRVPICGHNPNRSAAK